MTVQKFFYCSRFRSTVSNGTSFCNSQTFRDKILNNSRKIWIIKSLIIFLMKNKRSEYMNALNNKFYYQKTRFLISNFSFIQLLPWHRLLIFLVSYDSSNIWDSGDMEFVQQPNKTMNTKCAVKRIYGEVYARKYCSDTFSEAPNVSSMCNDVIIWNVISNANLYHWRVSESWFRPRGRNCKLKKTSNIFFIRKNKHRHLKPGIDK